MATEMKTGSPMATAMSEPAAVGPTPRWTPLRPHHQQSQVWCSDARIIALDCGRRSGKTELMKRRAVRHLPIAIANCPHTRYGIGAPTHDQAKEIHWQDLLDLIPDYWILGGKGGPNVSYSTLSITCQFNTHQATIRVFGLDKPHRIEGGYFNGFCGDEWSDVRPGIFDRVIRPMLADYHGWAVLGGVPKRQGVGSAWYRSLCEKISRGEYPDAERYHWPAADILDAAEIQHARETLDPKDFREQYDACWETAGGGVFHCFDRAYNVRPCSYHGDKPIIVGCDFNVDPMAWVLGHRYENRLEWFDEVWIKNTNTQAALNMLASRYDGHPGGWQFYGDASSQSRHTSASQSDYAQILNDERFKRMGRTIHFPGKNPDVADRFAACNAMFCNAAGDRRMFADDCCRHLIEDLENRSYREGTREVADGKYQGHITDAMGYATHRLFPIRVARAGLAAVITGSEV
jgi:hypothetical protein